MVLPYRAQDVGKITGMSTVQDSSQLIGETNKGIPLVDEKCRPEGSIERKIVAGVALEVARGRLTRWRRTESNVVLPQRFSGEVATRSGAVSKVS